VLVGVFYVYLYRTPLERVVHRLKHTSQRVCRPMHALLKVRAAPPKNSALCGVVTCAAQNAAPLRVNVPSSAFYRISGMSTAHLP
jgi:predicted amidophosphoribosyltransferase